MREGSDYCFEIDTADSRFSLKAELPTDHFDWVIAIEQILKQLKREKLLQGHRKRESSYIALKRLLLSEGQGGGAGGGGGGGSSQLYCLPRAFDDMEDIYDPPKKTPPPPAGVGKREHKRSELLRLSCNGVGMEGEEKNIGKIEEEEDKENVIPLPPKDYLPPPLPPRNDAPPPLPPKGRTLSLSRKSPPGHIPLDIRPSSVVSTGSGQSDPDNDYVMMQSSQQALSSGSQTPTTPYGSLGCSSVASQPITIPNRRTSASKRSVLLRGDSESSSITNSPPQSYGNSLREGMEMTSPLHSSHAAYSVSSSTHSLHRQNSITSLGSSYGKQGLPSPLSVRERDLSSGYNSPLLDMSPSPCLKRSQSHSYRINGTSKRLPMTGNGPHSGAAGRPESGGPSKSDGMMVSEVQNQFHHNHHHHHQHHHQPLRSQMSNGSTGRHMIGIPHTWSMESDGYGSSNSSTEDLSQVLDIFYFPCGSLVCKQLL